MDLEKCIAEYVEEPKPDYPYNIEVIIPSYNSANTINNALASCAMQILPDGRKFIVTIVDDCSTDGFDYFLLAEFWSTLMDIRIITKEKNEGCGRARQHGIDNAVGDCITFLDADDSFMTPYALYYMTEAIKDKDVAMGEFWEQTETGLVKHGMNWTWCHAKVYDTWFLKQNEMEFNYTRGNEDVGFNSIISYITDRVEFIPQPLYSWNNNKSSTVRTDRVGYSCGFGWRDFLENVAWACEQMDYRGVDSNEVSKFAANMLARFYFQYADSSNQLPDEMGENWNKVQDFYTRAVKPYVIEGMMPLGKLKTGYFTVVPEDGALAIPHMSFNEFITKLGYFDDLEAAKKDVTDNGNESK